MRACMLAVALCGLLAWAVRAGTPEEEFEAAFGVDAITVRSTAAVGDDIALAERVLDKAKATPDDAALQAYLCARAAEIAAVGAEGIPVVARAIETMIPLVPEARSPAEERLVKACDTLSRKVREGDDGRRANELLVQSLVMSGDDQLALGNAAAAVRTFNTALGSVSAQNCPLRHCLDEKLGIAKARQVVDRSVQKLEARLKGVLRDPATAQQLGMIRLLDFDDPAAAAQCFQGADADLDRDANVVLALKAPAELDEEGCLRLAVWYWGLAPKAGLLGKVNATARAKQYYEQYLLLHTEQDSKRASAQAALDQAAATLLRLRATLSGGWVDLLALVDPAKDYIGNPYFKQTDEGLSTVWGSQCTIMVPYEPPAEYDLEISFTCKQLKSGIGAICTLNGRLFACLVGADGNTKCGLERVGNLEVYRNDTARDLALQENRRYVLCVQVRARGVQVHLNQVRIINYPTNGSDLSPPHRWNLPNPRALGFGTYQDVAVFHSVWLHEVTGTGRLSAERGRPE